MYDIKQCPKCRSTKLSIERRPNGSTRCLECGYSNRHTSFNVIDEPSVVPYISHDDVRKALSTWSRESRDMMRLYVDQQETVINNNKLKEENFFKIIRLYDRLLEIRNEQLKDIPFNKRGPTVELDVHVCDKINKLKTKMGLPHSIGV